MTDNATFMLTGLQNMGPKAMRRWSCRINEVSIMNAEPPD